MQESFFCLRLCSASAFSANFFVYERVMAKEALNCAGLGVTITGRREYSIGVTRMRIELSTLTNFVSQKLSRVPGCIAVEESSLRVVHRHLIMPLADEYMHHDCSRNDR